MEYKWPPPGTMFVNKDPVTNRYKEKVFILWLGYRDDNPKYGRCFWNYQNKWQILDYFDPRTPTWHPVEESV